MVRGRGSERRTDREDPHGDRRYHDEEAKLRHPAPSKEAREASEAVLKELREQRQAVEDWNNLSPQEQENLKFLFGNQP
jgi:rRNA maturation endonuclease Nob1